jgi:DIS3-like exonuclease 2
MSEHYRPTGEVVFISECPLRQRDVIVNIKEMDVLFANKEVGGKKAKKKGGEVEFLGIPIVERLPWLSVPTPPQEVLDDLKSSDKVKNRYWRVRVTAWEPSCTRPSCEVRGLLGEAGNVEAEARRIILENEIIDEPYEITREETGVDMGVQHAECVSESLKVFMKDIDSVSGEWVIPQEEIAKRLDLREKRIFTIDPITARDLDDALSIEKVSENVFEIGVHIADVSYFVQQGTDLDEEARRRATSVYFPHRVIPMLPRLLCERLCSLNPQVDRLAYSVFFRMDRTTGALDRSFKPVIKRTVIRSVAKWNYELV